MLPQKYKSLKICMFRQKPNKNSSAILILYSFIKYDNNNFAGNLEDIKSVIRYYFLNRYKRM